MTTQTTTQTPPQTPAQTPAGSIGMFTAADLLDTPDDGRKYEVLEGALVVSPYARYVHQLWVKRSQDALDVGVPTGFVVLSGGNIDAGINAPVPDVLVVDTRLAENDLIFATPQDVLVAVEVLSPRQEARDRLLKRDIYARIGIPTYWIADPATESVTVLRLDREAYAEAYVGTDLAGAAEITWQR